MIALGLLVFAWTAMEASIWWVAPDISLSIAYVYYPNHWTRFILLALLGSFLGSFITFYWANISATYWEHYVTSMRFHSLGNLAYVESVIAKDNLAIIKGAWGGIPYKLFLGVAAIKGVSFTKIVTLGLLSRMIRFSFVLWITFMIRKFTKPFSVERPLYFSMVLLFIWGIMITLFDVFINQLYVS